MGELKKKFYGFLCILGEGKAAISFCGKSGFGGCKGVQAY